MQGVQDRVLTAEFTSGAGCRVLGAVLRVPQGAQCTEHSAGCTAGGTRCSVQGAPHTFVLPFYPLAHGPLSLLPWHPSGSPAPSCAPVTQALLYTEAPMGWGCPSVQVSRAQPALGLPSYTRTSVVAWVGGSPVRGVSGSVSLC